MIKLSIIIKETNGNTGAAFCNESENPTPMELAVLKNELEHGQIKDSPALRALAEYILKPATRNFAQSPAGNFVMSKAGNRRAS